MKNVGEKVITPHGEGEIVAIEKFSKTTRYGVLLNHNPYPETPILYYFPTEITSTAQIAVDAEKTPEK